jgi:hypothetical protein
MCANFCILRTSALRVNGVVSDEIIGDAVVGMFHVSHYQTELALRRHAQVRHQAGIK